MNKAKGRQHTRKAVRRAALRLKRAQKLNAKKIDRDRRIKAAKARPKKERPSDLRRRAKRYTKRLIAADAVAENIEG